MYSNQPLQPQRNLVYQHEVLPISDVHLPFLYSFVTDNLIVPYLSLMILIK